jgi:hypothetical protein
MSQTTSPTDRTAFRAELLLHLPELGRTRVPGGTGADGIQTRGYISNDVDYDPDALAAWILERVDGMLVDETARAVAGFEGMDAGMVEISTAAATFSACAEFASYLGQVAAVLRQGHSLASQWDLARTIDVEKDRLLGVVGALVNQFPMLGEVFAGASEPSKVAVTPPGR